MKTYLCCIGHEPWAFEVFRRVAGLGPQDSWFSYQPDDLSLLSLCRELRPRYIFFIHWSWYVPEVITGQFECVNIHCTDLPEGRGGGPIENLIKLGRTETVLTAHRMVADLDAGPIYGQQGPVSLAGTKAQILERFIEPCVDLIAAIVATEPEPVPQVGEPTYFKRLPKAEMDAIWAARS